MAGSVVLRLDAAVLLAAFRRVLPRVCSAIAAGDRRLLDRLALGCFDKGRTACCERRREQERRDRSCHVWSSTLELFKIGSRRPGESPMILLEIERVFDPSRRSTAKAPQTRGRSYFASGIS